MNPAEPIFKDVRPSDLRFENAHLLAEYIHQAQKFVDSNQSTSEELKATKEKVIELAKLTPGMMAQAEKKLNEVADRIIERHERASSATSERLLNVVTGCAKVLEDAHTELINSHQKLLKTFQDERAVLERERAQQEKFLAKIHQDQNKLEKARREFNSMSLWMRIFARA